MTARWGDRHAHRPQEGRGERVVQTIEGNLAGGELPLRGLAAVRRVDCGSIDCWTNVQDGGERPSSAGSGIGLEVGHEESVRWG